MNDLTSRIADLKQREDKTHAERARMIGAINKAITLIVTCAAFGVLAFISVAPTEASLKARALIEQESSHVAR